MELPPSFLRRLRIIKYALVLEIQVRGWICIREDKHNLYRILLNERLYFLCFLLDLFLHMPFIIKIIFYVYLQVIKYVYLQVIYFWWISIELTSSPKSRVS
jgi:hypothetical protein